MQCQTCCSPSCLTYPSKSNQNRNENDKLLEGGGEGNLVTWQRRQLAIYAGPVTSLPHSTSPCLPVCLCLWQLQSDGKIWIAIAKCGTGFRTLVWWPGSIRRVRVRGGHLRWHVEIRARLWFANSPSWLIYVSYQDTHSHRHSLTLTHTLTLGHLSMFIMESDMKCCCFYCCCWPINCSAQQIGNLSTGVHEFGNTLVRWGRGSPCEGSCNCSCKREAADKDLK